MRRFHQSSSCPSMYRFSSMPSNRRTQHLDKRKLRLHAGLASALHLPLSELTIKLISCELPRQPSELIENGVGTGLACCPCAEVEKDQACDCQQHVWRPKLKFCGYWRTCNPRCCSQPDFQSYSKNDIQQQVWQVQTVLQESCSFALQWGRVSWKLKMYGIIIVYARWLGCSLEVRERRGRPW